MGEKQGDLVPAATTKPLKIVIVSDIHLGHKDVDKYSFHRFLDSDTLKQLSCQSPRSNSSF